MEPSGYLWAGRAALWLGLVGALLSFWFYARRTAAGGLSAETGAVHELQMARSFYLFAATMVVFAWGYFVYQLVTHNFQSVYVYEHSSLAMPFKYIFAASWAGQSGSFFLWLMWAWVVGVAVMRTSRDREPEAMAAYMAIPVILIGTLLVIGPFKLWPQVPADGAGLNPLLRDPWMVIHPPVMFLGYVAVSIPFAFAAASIWKGDYDGWIVPALPWALFGWVVLGVAICMGGFWAYKTLGWGGWWGWDPVENASLLPWLTATGLVHGMLLQKSRGKLRRSNAVLAGVTFLLVLYSTFLTRSGVLEGASVHSFVDPGLAIYLEVVLAVGFLLMLGTVVRHYRRTGSEALSEHLLSREIMFMAMAVIFGMLALLIGLGTSAPMFTSWFQDNPSLVDVSFYERTAAPLAFAIAVLMGLAPLVGWKGDAKAPRGIRWSLAAAGVALLLGLLGGMRAPFSLLFLAAVGLAVGTNVQAVSRAYGRGGIIKAGGYLAHLGVTLIFISILAQGGSRTAKADLQMGTPRQVMEYTMTFMGWQIPDEGSDAKQAAVVDVSWDAGRRTIRTYPRMFQVFGSGQWMMRTEPYIHRTLAGDLYISPAEFRPRSIGDVGGLEQAVKKGQTVTAGGYVLTFTGFEFDADHMSGSDENTAWAVIEAARDGESQTVKPSLVVSPEGMRYTEAYLDDLDPAARPVVSVSGINVDDGSITLVFFPTAAGAVDPAQLGGTLTVEVQDKPLMNLLWIGVLIVIFGGFTSAWKRYRQFAAAH